MRKYLLGGIAALGLIGASVWALQAQIGGIVADTLTGRECWNATQFANNQGFGAGPGLFICSFLTQNSQGITTTTTATGAVNATLLGGSDYIFTAALTGGITFNLPPMPVPNGWIVEIVNGTASNFTQTITVTPATGETVVGSTSLVNITAGASNEYRFAVTTTNNQGVATAGVWYQLR